MNKVLFLCTGNFYRSRVAEYLFNDLATHVIPNWKADSRGLGVNSLNSTPISPAAVSFLNSTKVEVGFPRNPLQVELSDLLWADRIVALNEQEHRPTIRNQFAFWEDRIEFWNVPDIDRASWKKALPKLEANVRELISIIRAEAITKTDRVKV